MPGVPPDLKSRLHTVLLRCGPFASEGALRAAFADARIYPWRDELPYAGSPADYARRVVEYLCDRADAQNRNVLVLFLHVLAEQCDPKDACHHDLAGLAGELACVLAPPAADPPPPASPAARAGNPFCDRGCIGDPARFFDRVQILRELRQALAAGNSISLVGEPEIGKSSLFYTLYATAGEWLPGKRVHYVDLQAVLDEDDFCAEALEGLGCAPGDLRALKNALRRESLVLLLDEVEKLTRPAFTQDLHDLLRALAQRDTLTLAVSSHRPLAEIFPPSGATSPLHNIFTEKRLGPLAAEDARRFLQERLRATGIAFTADEIAQLVAASGGHPARLQRLAYDLFERYRG
ncbi:MAG: ATP-binding protein [Anaerolineae bacterium]|nr:ATP-binding protein [Anaerolineae bacterium]